MNEAFIFKLMKEGGKTFPQNKKECFLLNWLRAEDTNELYMSGSGIEKLLYGPLKGRDLNAKKMDDPFLEIQGIFFLRSERFELLTMDIVYNRITEELSFPKQKSSPHLEKKLQELKKIIRAYFVQGMESPQFLDTSVALTPWMYEYDEDDPTRKTFAFRAIVGTDYSDSANRVAGIEKSPRIRVLPYLDFHTENFKWVYGPKGDEPDDKFSKLWCDARLKACGFSLDADHCQQENEPVIF